jgi:hypothetical protein
MHVYSAVDGGQGRLWLAKISVPLMRGMTTCTLAERIFVSSSTGATQSHRIRHHMVPLVRAPALPSAIQVS